MTGSNKILTVSYGTFSCTLEGFDQPFNTMQSIAEYFRDLAAEDRYFGAEPPQPDAQMLHQIAEREVQKRVEARIAKNGVVLRQMEQDSALPAPLSAPSKPAAAAPAEDYTPPAPAAAASGDSVADKLSRIRAVVAKARAEAQNTAPDDGIEDAVVSDDIDAAFTDDASDEDRADAASEEMPLMDDLSVPAEPTVAEDEPDDAEEEARAKAEAERAEEEARAQAEAERAEEEARAKAEAERAEKEARAKAEAERAEEEARVKAEAERAEEEARAKAEAERAEEEARAKAEAERAEVARLKAEAAEAELAAIERTRAEETAHAEAERARAKAEAIAAELAAIEAAQDDADEADEAEAPVADMDDVDPAESDIDAPETAETEADTFEDADAAVEANADAIEDDAAPLPPQQARPAAPVARVIKLKRSDFEAALAAGDIEEIEDDDDAGDDLTAEIDIDDDGTEPLTAEAEAEEDLSDEDLDDDGADTLIAGLMAEEDEDDRSERRDGDGDEDDNMFSAAADDHADGEEVAQADADSSTSEDDDDLSAGIRDLVSASGLDAEDEDDLVAELAEVEREARRAEAGETAEADAPSEPRQMRSLDELIAEETGETWDEDEAVEVASDEDDDDADDQTTDAAPQNEGEEALKRLLDKTNAQLGDAEGNRRRSAIAHLKAAVAATKADGKLRDKRQEEDAEAISQFRDDLAQVVRPSRPAPKADGGRTGRPQADIPSRPAPLVLVSEQRVDSEVKPRRSMTITPSRPQRVSAARPTAAKALDGESFRDFAARVGAKELPDMLEAAAVYAKIVEGQEGVSRPTILRRAASAAEGEITREQGLQSFGQLLRSGRIRKVGKGQFAVDDSAEMIERARATGS
ncbi:hypothetical protein SAMN04488012_105179 [Palleronia salina]|uniref:Lipoprotein n=1 Tax=Palleronia salina TaxID=313368 RepID=A0A1M6H1T3_9RHOB|nr:hypothetical protein [Palleronia salina]SHJ16149.1 hypothetical protein SAMN04488012_105179 [Palleronia salina]